MDHNAIIVSGSAPAIGFAMRSQIVDRIDVVSVYGPRCLVVDVLDHATDIDSDLRNVNAERRS